VALVEVGVGNDDAAAGAGDVAGDAFALGEAPVADGGAARAGDLLADEVAGLGIEEPCGGGDGAEEVTDLGEKGCDDGVEVEGCGEGVGGAVEDLEFLGAALVLLVEPGGMVVGALALPAVVGGLEGGVEEVWGGVGCGEEAKAPGFGAEVGQVLVRLVGEADDGQVEGGEEMASLGKGGRFG
jgi:hypothetical protein